MVTHIKTIADLLSTHCLADTAKLFTNIISFMLVTILRDRFNYQFHDQKLGEVLPILSKHDLFVILYNDFFLFNPIHLNLGTVWITSNVLADSDSMVFLCFISSTVFLNHCPSLLGSLSQYSIPRVKSNPFQIKYQIYQQRPFSFSQERKK